MLTISRWPSPKTAPYSSHGAQFVKFLVIELDSTSIQVVALCGRLPLVLAIAGSMSVVKGKGLTAGAWNELIKLFEDVVTMMSESGEESKALDVVLGASFSDLAARKREEFLKMALLAPGAVAPIEMLQNLWETEVRCGFPLAIYLNLQH